MVQRLGHAIVARVSLAGFVTHEIPLTEGPMDWVDLHGRHHGQYWLFKSDHFQVDLVSVASAFTGSVSATPGLRPLAVQPELTLEEVVQRTKPAVVRLKALNSSGSGFFVTETGIIATNAHVARGDSSLLALLPNGAQLPAKVVYIDANVDLALVKVDPPSADFMFPHLTLADASLVRQGESVLVIGNPGDAMLFSVTKGIVSAVGQFPAAGPGTWIQTDAPINPGNSGGPLVNIRGEVIGINTLKVVGKNVSGISFALSAGDLLALLRRFYPNTAPAQRAAKATAHPSAVAADTQELAYPATPAPTEPMDSFVPPIPPTSSPQDFGTLTITSDLESAEIYVDAKFIGNAPATLKIPVGPHSVLVKSPGLPDCVRVIDVPRSSKLILKALFLVPPSP